MALKNLVFFKHPDNVGNLINLYYLLRILVLRVCKTCTGNQVYFWSVRWRVGHSLFFLPLSSPKPKKKLDDIQMKNCPVVLPNSHAFPPRYIIMKFPTMVQIFAVLGPRIDLSCGHPP